MRERERERESIYRFSYPFRQVFIESCREFKSTIQNARKHSMKALGFSKTLLTDLEIAAEFSIRCSHDKLFEVLTSSDHTQVHEY